MTNPPFYSTVNEASAPRAGDKRCRTDMSTNEGVYNPPTTGQKISGANGDDVVEHAKEVDNNNNTNNVDGGDVGFITSIMNDSQYFKQHVTWYTSLVAKRSSLDRVLQKLQSLDGIWGNRGQIRTVEFHQGNLDVCEEEEVDDGRSSSTKNSGSNNRVRWGIAWTYERAVGRCSACRIRGGLQSFDVSIDAVGDANDKTALDEVVSRLIDYFENLRDVSMKCSHQTIRRQCENGGIDTSKEKSADSRVGRCVTAVEERFHNRNPFHLPVLNYEHDNNNLPYEGHFIIDAFVKCNQKYNDGSNGNAISVQVVLEIYSHTKHGSTIINKIRGPMPGEIGRTNRRWRRLLKKQQQGTI